MEAMLFDNEHLAGPVTAVGMPTDQAADNQAVRTWIDISNQVAIPQKGIKLTSRWTVYCVLCIEADK
jgi:hypothetical protein